MEQVFSLILAVDYMEEHLLEPVDLRDVAAASCMSLSHLHRLFSHVFHCSLKEYLTKRRLCRAAHDLLQSQETVTDLAFKYQYGSVEGFSRAFRAQFLLSPSQFRRNSQFAELHPRRVAPNPMAGGNAMCSKQGFTLMFDVPELSEQLLAAKGTYILDVDIDHLMTINETLGRKAGDAAIAAAAGRIERAVPTGTVFFRIGADEFVVLTKTTDVSAAEAIAQRILSFAGEPLSLNGENFHFSVSVGISKVPLGTLDVQDALGRVHEAMIQAKRERRSSYKVM